MDKRQTVSKRIPHYLFKEGAYFAEFIFECLSQEGIIIQREVRARSKESDLVFDGFAENGFPELTQKGTYVDIKYTNASDVLMRYIATHRKSFGSDPVVVISLMDDCDKNFAFSLPNVHFLGASYVAKLIRKYPRQWWVFVSSSSTDNEIVYDESHKTIRVANPPIAALALGKEVFIDEKHPEGLSAISEADFKRRIKVFHNPAMIIGNGVSIHFGSDLWNKMSDTLFDYLSPKYVDNVDLVKKSIGGSTYSSTSMSRFMIEQKKYDQALYSSVYRKYEGNMHVDGTLVRSIVKAKKKFPKMPVLSYNYDEFLELDYQKYTGSKMIGLASKRSYNSAPEPKVAHVHGRIPFKRPSSQTKVVLTQEDYFNAYKGHSWIPEIQREVLRNNTCLFVGSSMSDIYQMSIINEINTRYYSEEKPYPWRCFALLCLKGLSPKDIVAVFNYYLSKGIYIIFTKEFSELPDKLLDLFA